jgi:hypothetical protein
MEHALPFAHLRVVLDPVTSSLPTEDLGIDEQREAGEGSPLLWRALWRPRAWPAVWRLFRQVRIAGQALTDLAAALVAPDGPLSIGG